MTDKLKVGLLDMLTLLLPGGLLIFILSKKGPLAAYLSPYFQILTGDENAWPRVVLFIAAAYVAGHFIYLLASNLDDWIYENVRKVFWNDHRLAAYILERKSAITGIHEREIINGFKWSCAWLLKNAPTQYAEVERVMAESKFFRSLVVVCFISFVILIFSAKWPVSLLFLLLSFLSLFRYLTQRQKCIDAAYIYMITALSEKTAFPEHPDREKLFELRAKSIPSLANAGKAAAYETRKMKRKLTSFKGYGRKVWEVVKLCAWPGYVFDIMPEGSPDYKSYECRWFMQKDPALFKEWLLQHCGTTMKFEERPDTYHSKKGMEEMSIKDRGNKNDFEIKRLLPFEETVLIAPQVTASFQSWYKWNVQQKDTDRLEKLLKSGHYHLLEVNKKRWSGKIACTRFQAEYTIVEVAGWPVWYSIALELPYSVKPAEAIDALTATGIDAALDITAADWLSYPAFLQQQLEKKIEKGL